LNAVSRKMPANATIPDADGTQAVRRTAEAARLVPDQASLSGNTPPVPSVSGADH